jgi:hypothetical protein
MAAWMTMALLGTAALGTAGAAKAQQSNNVMPTREELARADRYVPPKLTALAAKLASQPDMTGSWVHIQPPGACRGPLFDPPNSTCPPPPPEGEATFGPMPGTRMTGIPYTPEYQKMYDQHVEEAKEGKARDTFAACIPYGVPRMVGDSPTPFDIVQAPEIMSWYNNYARTYRRIFLDGRPHPKGDDERLSGPSYSGHSIGHWEGNTLVIDTVNMINAFFDETASPHSDKLHMIERLRLIAPNLLENEMTLIDPVAFTKPWVVKRYYRRASEPGKQIVHRYQELNDRPCIPNVKMDENGFQVILLPQEIEAETARAEGRPVPKN